MRMRKRPNLVPRMERCASVQIAAPRELIGRWRTLKPDASELALEIGCGKGRFTIETAKQNPDVLFIAIEKVPDCLVIAMESAVREKLSNVFFISADASDLTELFAKGEIDRIYLNFSDPWPRSKNAKRRLTHRDFLEKYAWVLSDMGRIEFKTDNEKLFTWSLDEFRDSGWSLCDINNDLHKNGPVGIMTDYEAKFYELGTPIHRLVGFPEIRPSVRPVRKDYIRKPDQAESDNA